MSKEELIKALTDYEEMCDNADTWFDSDLVEHALSLIDSVKEYLQNN